jgi:hypothetical protein
MATLQTAAAFHLATRRAVDSAAADGDGGQPVGSAWWRIGETGSVHVGAAHDLPTAALDSASRCPQPLGQPAPAGRASRSVLLRARVAHTAHSPHDDRIVDFSERGPLRRVLDPEKRRDRRTKLGGGPPRDELAAAAAVTKPGRAALTEERAVNEHGAADREALTHLVSRTARVARLDEDHRAADAGHDAVARREVPARGGGAGLKRGNDEVLSRDLSLERLVMPGVGLVERGADDGDRAAAVVHRGFVRRRVDACRETGDDHKTLANELARDLSSQRSAFVRSAPGAYDGDARAIEQAHIAGHVEASNPCQRHRLGFRRELREGLHVAH